MLSDMIVTFCGHRQVENEDQVRQWLENAVDGLIREGADVFYLGGYGGFDRMALTVVNKAKEAHPGVRAILVLPYLDRSIDLDAYDGSVYPPLEKVPRRYAISRRNRWMVDQADVVVAYVIHEWGGAATTLRYAEAKKKTIIRFPE